MVTDKAPAFQFYPRDWRDFKVARLSLESKGAYIDLLGYMFLDSPDQHSLPYDIHLIAKALGVSRRKAQTIIDELQNPAAPIFDVEDRDGELFLVSRRMKHDAFLRNQRRLSSTAAAQYRWDSKGSKRRKSCDRIGSAPSSHMRNGSSSLSASTSIDKDCETDDAPGRTFAEWKAEHMCTECSGKGCDSCQGLGYRLSEEERRAVEERESE